MSLWEGDQEVVKRSGRDEPVQVVIHMCMEAMLGISLYSYPHLKLAKTLSLSYYCFMSFLQHNWGRGQNKFCLEERGLWGEEEGVGGREERWPKQCMHI
jgi:hypothetical protein